MKQNKENQFTIRRQLEITLDKDEELRVVRKWVREYPKVIEILQKYPDRRGYCPFPEECERFPCDTLSCNADSCDNGYAYRMS